jgi:uracil-DNA glycosylase
MGVSFRLADHWDFGSSWHALDAEFCDDYPNNLIGSLDQFLSKELDSHGCFYPAPHKNIFRAFKLTPLEKVRVVIVGQDPYSTAGLATGLCFSVPDPLPTDTQRPYSLARIYNRIEADIGGKPSRSGDLEPWALDGVLLMNTVLTVAKNKPGSHRGFGWERFTNRAIELVDDQPNRFVFMLWGNEARRKAELIDRKRHCVLEAAHPRSPEFSRCDHFSRADDELKPSPVRWLRA